MPGVRTRVESVDRDIEVFFREELSPTARSQTLAAHARDVIDETDRTNQSILGRIPKKRVFVDGREGAQLQSVRPDGIIVAEYEVFTDMLAWIGNQLVLHSPVKSGTYARSHTLFADGTEIAVGATLPDAEEYVFINNTPYARKIELGSSSQAPDGVYEAVAVLASRRFGNMGNIRFSYRAQVRGGLSSLTRDKALRQPAIVVRAR